MEGTAFSDDRPHRLEPEFFEGLPFLFKIFHAVLLINAACLEKAVKFDAGKTEHMARLHFSDAACPECFQSDAFESHARDITTTFEQLGRNRIRNVNSYVHTSAQRAGAGCANISIRERSRATDRPLGV